MGMFDWLTPKHQSSSIPAKAGPVKQPPYPPAVAPRFSDGGSLRTIYARPYGPRSNPLSDIRGNGGHFVNRSMEPYTPAIVLGGNTIRFFSPAGIASTVYFNGVEHLPLFDPNAGNS